MRIVFEKVRDSEGASFAFNRVGGEVFECPYHVHPEVEVLHILSGQGHLVVGDHVGRFGPGDLLLLGSGLPHVLRSDPGSRPELRYLQFRPEDFGGPFWGLRELRPVAGMLAQASRGLRFDAQAAAAAGALLDRLWAAAGAARLVLLLELLGSLAAALRLPMASVGYAPRVSHRDSERLDRALRYISDHLTEGLALEAVAARAGLSQQAFSRFFHQGVGLSYIDYVLSLRTSLACRYLLESEKSVAEIAFSSGFNNLSNFNRQFRKLKGMNPRAYRATSWPVPAAGSTG